MTGDNESPRLATEGEEADRTSALSIPHRRSCVKSARKRYPPHWQPHVVVDDFARDPDIDFPIACFEPWPWGAS